jgi:hypothetical protein
MDRVNVPEELAALLAGWPEPGRAEQAFPFLTVDEAGFPHAALLSRAELDVSPDRSAVLAVVASTRTRANLERDGRATLIAVGGTTAHYAKLRVTRRITGGGALGCRLAVAGHKADSLGIPLSPAGFTATAEIGRLERWQDSRRLLASLNDSQR